MLQNYNRYGILQVFFDEPLKAFHLREISRITNLGLPSVRNHVLALKKEGFVIEGKDIYATYMANRNDERYKLYKRADMLLRVNECGLVKFLVDTFLPNAIVLFGSGSRGEDGSTSDLDILVVAKEQKVGLKKFEQQLKRKISIYFEPDLSSMSKELLNNMANGILLYGYLKVV